MFLLRAAFWLTLVVLLIPADPEAGTEAPRVTFFQALGAAQATVADMSSFCDRNPEVCETGVSTFQLIEMKARHGARMLFDQFQGGDDKTAPSSEAKGTLSEGDREIPWREPAKKGAV